MGGKGSGRRMLSYEETFEEINNSAKYKTYSKLRTRKWTPWDNESYTTQKRSANAADHFLISQNQKLSFFKRFSSVSLVLSTLL